MSTAPRISLPDALTIAAVLPLLYGLKSAGITDFGFFGVRPAYAEPQLMGLLITYALLWLALKWAPQRLWVKLRLAGGLVGAMIAIPHLLAPLILILAATHRIIHQAKGGMTRRWIGLGLLFSALGAGAWLDQRFYAREVAEVMVALVFFRSLQYMQEAQRDRFKAKPFWQFLAYQISLPTLIIHPYLAVIPRFQTTFHDKVDGKLAQDGRRLIAISLVTLVAARFIFFGQNRLFPDQADLGALYMPWAMVDMLVLLAYSAANAGFLIGLYAFLGQRIRPAFNQPWLSRNLFDYWNRFIIHYKDLQVSLIYFPTVLGQSKRGKVIAIWLGVFATFMIGNNLFHLWGRYLYNESLFTGMPHAILQNIALTVVMGLALWWEDHKAAKRMAKGNQTASKPGALMGILGVFFTLAVVSWIWHL